MPSSNPTTSSSLGPYLTRCSKSERRSCVILSTKSLSSGKSSKCSRRTAESSPTLLSTSVKARIRHHKPGNNNSINSNENINDDDNDGFQIVSAETATSHGNNRSMLIGRRWSDKFEAEESSYSFTDEDDVFCHDNSFVSNSSSLSSVSSTLSPSQPQRIRSVVITIPDDDDTEDDAATATSSKKTRKTKRKSNKKKTMLCRDSFDNQSLYPLVW